MYETSILAIQERKSSGKTAFPGIGICNLYDAVLTSKYSRLENKLTRKDFLTNVVDKVNSGEISREEMTAHASSLVQVTFLPSQT